MLNCKISVGQYLLIGMTSIAALSLFSKKSEGGSWGNFDETADTGGWQGNGRTPFDLNIAGDSLFPATGINTDLPQDQLPPDQRFGQPSLGATQTGGWTDQSILGGQDTAIIDDQSCQSLENIGYHLNKYGVEKEGSTWSSQNGKSKITGGMKPNYNPNETNSNKYIAWGEKIIKQAPSVFEDSADLTGLSANGLEPGSNADATIQQAICDGSGSFLGTTGQELFGIFNQSGCEWKDSNDSLCKKDNYEIGRPAGVSYDSSKGCCRVKRDAIQFNKVVHKVVADGQSGSDISDKCVLDSGGRQGQGGADASIAEWDGSRDIDSQGASASVGKIIPEGSGNSKLRTHPIYSTDAAAAAAAAGVTQPLGSNGVSVQDMECLLDKEKCNQCQLELGPRCPTNNWDWSGALPAAQNIGSWKIQMTAGSELKLSDCLEAKDIAELPPPGPGEPQRWTKQEVSDKRKAVLAGTPYGDDATGGRQCMTPNGNGTWDGEEFSCSNLRLTENGEIDMVSTYGSQLAGEITDSLQTVDLNVKLNDNLYDQTLGSGDIAGQKYDKLSTNFEDGVYKGVNLTPLEGAGNYVTGDPSDNQFGPAATAADTINGNYPSRDNWEHILGDSGSNINNLPNIFRSVQGAPTPALASLCCKRSDISNKKTCAMNYADLYQTCRLGGYANITPGSSGIDINKLEEFLRTHVYMEKEDIPDSDKVIDVDSQFQAKEKLLQALKNAGSGKTIDDAKGYFFPLYGAAVGQVQGKDDPYINDSPLAEFFEYFYSYFNNNDVLYFGKNPASPIQIRTNDFRFSPLSSIQYLDNSDKTHKCCGIENLNWRSVPSVKVFFSTPIFFNTILNNKKLDDKTNELTNWLDGLMHYDQTPESPEGHPITGPMAVLFSIYILSLLIIKFINNVFGRWFYGAKVGGDFGDITRRQFWLLPLQPLIVLWNAIKDGGSIMKSGKYSKMLIHIVLVYIYLSLGVMMSVAYIYILIIFGRAASYYFGHPIKKFYEDYEDASSAFTKPNVNFRGLLGEAKGEGAGIVTDGNTPIDQLSTDIWNNIIQASQKFIENQPTQGTQNKQDLSTTESDAKRKLADLGPRGIDKVLK